jgi:hypothetical protein
MKDSKIPRNFSFDVTVSKKKELPLHNSAGCSQDGNQCRSGGEKACNGR